jgi:hypothetical protein
MYYGNNAAGEDYQLEQSPMNRALAVLKCQCVDTVELQAQVARALESEASGSAQVQMLLDGIKRELGVCRAWLEERMALCSPGPGQSGAAELAPSPLRGLTSGEGFDCVAHLATVLSAYLKYARATSESITFLEFLGDSDSVKIMRRISSVVDRGIWFLEIYMEGLSLHMDTSHLPKYVTAASGSNYL